MKKTFALLLALILIVSSFSICAFAAEADTVKSELVTHRYTYFANCWAGLKSTGGGWYNVTGGAGSMHGEMKISVTVILQRYSRSSPTAWEDISTWTDSAPYSASCGSSYYLATPGTYRTHVIANIYLEDGTLGETETVNSNHITIQ